MVELTNQETKLVLEALSFRRDFLGYLDKRELIQFQKRELATLEKAIADRLLENKHKGGSDE